MCTSEYKVKPIRRRIRELLGYPHPARVPSAVWVEQWVGFSADEVHRMRDLGVRYARARYPLIELGMDRRACQRWLRARGWGSTPRSACVGCPFHGNRTWRRMRDERPDEWRQAVAFDAAIRWGGARGRPLRGEAFLHASRVPLDRAPIDRVSRSEWADRQGEIWDMVEDGDPDGCSPYGCRSGAPAALGGE
ncbi:hypothetical protein [Jiangella alkaliphila]|uniref:hypothetical protein n=1 Tax=Jiangella alkaliphila TaxID=419479 RepID=UPI0018D4D188|nr:hypothetical protein [Jiangella alkaliphila]